MTSRYSKLRSPFHILRSDASDHGCWRTVYGAYVATDAAMNTTRLPAMDSTSIRNDVYDTLTQVFRGI